MSPENTPPPPPPPGRYRHRFGPGARRRRRRRLSVIVHDRLHGWRAAWQHQPSVPATDGATPNASLRSRPPNARRHQPAPRRDMHTSAATSSAICSSVHVSRGGRPETPLPSQVDVKQLRLIAQRGQTGLQVAMVESEPAMDYHQYRLFHQRACAGRNPSPSMSKKSSCAVKRGSAWAPHRVC